MDKLSDRKVKKVGTCVICKKEGDVRNNKKYGLLCNKCYTKLMNKNFTEEELANINKPTNDEDKLIVTSEDTKSGGDILSYINVDTYIEAYKYILYCESKQSELEEIVSELTAEMSRITHKKLNMELDTPEYMQLIKQEHNIIKKRHNAKTVAALVRTQNKREFINNYFDKDYKGIDYNKNKYKVTIMIKGINFSAVFEKQIRIIYADNEEEAKQLALAPFERFVGVTIQYHSITVEKM